MLCSIFQQLQRPSKSQQGTRPEPASARSASLNAKAIRTVALTRASPVSAVPCLLISALALGHWGRASTLATTLTGRHLAVDYAPGPSASPTQSASSERGRT